MKINPEINQSALAESNQTENSHQLGQWQIKISKKFNKEHNHRTENALSILITGNNPPNQSINRYAVNS
jgi:hypothetical protein